MATWSTPDNKELSSGFFVIRLFSAKKGCIWQKDMVFNILYIQVTQVKVFRIVQMWGVLKVQICSLEKSHTNTYFKKGKIDYA